MDDLFGAVLRLMIFLPLVVVLAYLSIKYGLGKAQHFRVAAHLQVVDRLILGPKAGLYVVKVVDRYYVLAVNEHRTTLLKELADYPVTSNCPEQGLNAAPFLSEWVDCWTAKFKQRGKTS
ncbi:flagellar biosynthetic protein FliO [Zhaonella formicivorans]|jgi:flagellar protein FliO/FliZ|uniref:flagellar biosynthetic protein FliO n=1 Tax=Zhaonella formicivorans TaxID=2528593 RepID=UPI0010EEDB01|nr:flagellar biosynthetic protein FliO [Zhaonella formicivorans]